MRIQGSITDVMETDPPTISVRAQQGIVHILLDPACSITRRGRHAAINDLVPGARIAAEIVVDAGGGRTATSIDVLS